MIKVPKRLITETQELIRIKFFLDECGLSKYPFTVRELKKISKIITGCQKNP